ncbi:MAG: MFS transporter [Microcystis sp.]
MAALLGRRGCQQSQPPTIPLSRLIRQSYHQVWHTLAYFRQNQEIFKFLVGFYLISDGIVTLNNFLGIYLNQDSPFAHFFE